MTFVKKPSGRSLLTHRMILLNQEPQLSVTVLFSFVHLQMVSKCIMQSDHRESSNNGRMHEGRIHVHGIRLFTLSQFPFFLVKNKPWSQRKWCPQNHFVLKFWRPLIPLFWTFGDVCLGFQSQGGSLYHRTLNCILYSNWQWKVDVIPLDRGIEY